MAASLNCRWPVISPGRSAGKAGARVALEGVAAQISAMCNLYSMTSNREAIRALAKFIRDFTGNQPSLPGIFPNYMAPIVRNSQGERELANARWGMPSHPVALKGRNSDPGTTNIRNLKLKHWQRWLGVENRCLVPFTSFSENEHLLDGTKPPVWFAFSEDRPLAFFAGVKPPVWFAFSEDRPLAFLTTEPNQEVGAIHPKAMPVILTTPVEIETWMTAPREEALKLQRALPDGSLQIVARGSKNDG